MIGTGIAHFQIEALIGAGGMGEVYRARDTRLGRSVAVKVLPEVLAGDAERAARFEREAKLLGALNHANIAALYGLEQAGGRHFLVMELVEGDTLAEVIARGPVAIVDALKIAHQIAEALEAAHEKGIIHRDLKPANVKVTPDGKVKVLDFGLAKAFQEPSPEAGQLNTHSPTLSVMATNAGMILGTAGYMSPEQARGHNTDARSDIFSFACVLFEMLTGRQTFHGDTITDVIASVVARDPDWRALPANLHPKAEELIRRCLAKNRKDRWHAIGDVRVELEAVMADPHGQKQSGVREAPRKPWWRRALPIVGTVVLAAGIAVAATVVAMNRRPTPPAIVTRFPFVLPDGLRFTNNARNLVAISPDGATIAFEANQQLYVRSMGDTDARSVAGTAQNAAAPFFSPDGKWLGYFSRAENRIKKIAVTGGAAVTIASFTAINSNVGLGPVWSVDGYVYFGQLGAIMRVSANGGTPEPIIRLEPDEVSQRPQLLPDRDTLLFTLAAGNGGFERWDRGQIVVQSLKSGTRKVVIQGGGDARYVPTGHLVYAIGNTVLAVPFDQKKLEAGGPGPVPVIEGVRRGGGGADSQFAMAENGSMVYIPGSQSTANDVVLTVVDQSGSRKPLSVPSGSYVTPRISPDGKYFAVHSDDGKDVTVWIGDLNDVTPIRKLTFEGRNRDPLWTLDGRRIAFASDRGDGNGNFSIFWQRVDGGAAERLSMADPGARPQLESWSADGKTLVFTNRLAGSGGGISVLSIGGEPKPQQVVKPPATNASLSPDGGWLAYASIESGRTEVYVQPLPPTGEKHQVTTDGGLSPLWSRDGRRLFFLRGSTNTQQLMATDIQTTHRFAIGKTTGLPIPAIANNGPRPYDVSPDGKSFLVMLPKGMPASDKPPAEQINVTLNWFEELKQRVPVK